MLSFGATLHDVLDHTAVTQGPTSVVIKDVTTASPSPRMAF
jgi:hypothetical protein